METVFEAKKSGQQTPPPSTNSQGNKSPGSTTDPKAAVRQALKEIGNQQQQPQAKVQPPPKKPDHGHQLQPQFRNKSQMAGELKKPPHERQEKKQPLPTQQERKADSGTSSTLQDQKKHSSEDHRPERKPDQEPPSNRSEMPKREPPREEKFSAYTESPSLAQQTDMLPQVHVAPEDKQALEVLTTATVDESKEEKPLDTEADTKALVPVPERSLTPAIKPEITPVQEASIVPVVKGKKKEEVFEQPTRVILEVRTSRSSEETPASMVQFLSSLSNLRYRYLLLWKKGIPLTLELAVLEQSIHFYISVPAVYQAFAESQLVSQYPKAMLAKSKDYLPQILDRTDTLMVGQLKPTTSYTYPIRNFNDFKDVDPMSSLLGILSKAQSGDEVCLQYLLVPISQSWQKTAQKQATTKQTDSTGATIANPYSAVMTEKASAAGFSVSVRVAIASETKERSAHFMYEIGNSFSSFNHPSGNGLQLKKALPWQRQRLIDEMRERKKSLMTFMHIYNVNELATLFHFPGAKLANIPNISWHKVILSQAPENLPIAEGLSDIEKKEINFFARTEYKNKQMTFGIKRVDRRRHVYVIGKSGTGKSTFIANMAINDMRNGEGFCVIDPHGDLCEHILSYVPSYRVNDIIYMDPSDTERSFALNPLEVRDDAQKELVASGIVAIFKKLYGESWGPRLEYILRNTIVSIIEMPNATLLMVPDMLANPVFRAKVVERVKDPVLRSFWMNEFDKMTDKLRVEAISPIQNKVGQFTSSTRIRNIIGHSKSSIDIEKAMNEGKIIILNLSQGYLGEDNAALLGAMIITKIQLAAMNRVSIPEAQRRDFFLYVDEFQNFATTSFIKILSEARKFRLCLILANQYIAQIPEDVRAAIFGNAGTLMSFLIGAEDATFFAKEFSERFKEEDLLALGNYQAILKLYIDGITQSPFHCYTLPLPKSVTQNGEKAKRISRERYTKPVDIQ